MPEISPLARRLADTHAVDLAALEAKSPEAKITARNVLEHLSASSEAAKRGGQDGPETDVSVELGSSKTLNDGKVYEDMPGATAQPVEEPTQPVATSGDVSALERTRAQLQATAQAHQQALMQVGALRERNSALAHEVEQLRVAGAQAQSELQVLREQKAQLEELERSKSGTFAWLRKLVS